MLSFFYVLKITPWKKGSRTGSQAAPWTPLAAESANEKSGEGATVAVHYLRQILDIRTHKKKNEVFLTARRAVKPLWRNEICGTEAHCTI